MKFRKATIADATALHKLINDFASIQLMLPRSLHTIYGNIREYFVCCGRDTAAETLSDLQGKVPGASSLPEPLVGVCALHILWEDLAEIKSLAVHPSSQRRGIGGRLLDSCLKEAIELGVNRVFALTYVPEFFLKYGFEKIDKSLLPHKTWGDCINCPKFPACDEQAVLITL
ncbi:GNAT family N-acetyltransferase [Candidatus Magnetobacterium casense]|uniref:GNAT family N-acetyltransferase n=1 Tax=Candidatus Magnetobacterium casense TaxID=1455061 RepID=A0ABS6RZM8_9BACT|nr:GNAT family N-acetyltransferase [Candidatus Magnetobacterium casensis]MBV6341583.1 GNAT family N-acetyltransferase [Candidatus Magnetobacterium casensis]